jgi:hypothetical protein
MGGGGGGIVPTYVERVLEITLNTYRLKIRRLILARSSFNSAPVAQAHNVLNKDI